MTGKFLTVRQPVYEPPPQQARVLALARGRRALFSPEQPSQEGDCYSWNPARRWKPSLYFARALGRQPPWIYLTSQEPPTFARQTAKLPGPETPKPLTNATPLGGVQPSGAVYRVQGRATIRHGVAPYPPLPPWSPRSGWYPSRRVDRPPTPYLRPGRKRVV